MPSIVLTSLTHSPQAHPYMDLYNGHEHFIREIVLKMKASW